MRRFRRRLALRPVNSVKNIVDTTLLGVAAGTVSTILIGNTVNNYAGAVTDIPIGAKVSSIYLFFQIIPTTTNTNVDWYIIRRPANVINPVPGATGGDVARRFILHEEKGIPGNFGSGQSPLTFRGVIKIPKGRQRWAEGDVIQIAAIGAATYNVCMKAIYKFYQ